MKIDEQNGPALMAAATAETVRVVGNVNAGELDSKTPCTDWDLRTLLNHTILWTAYSAEQRAYGQSVAEDLMSKDFTAEPGFAEDYQAQAARAVAAWSDPAAWHRELGVMGNNTPAADIAAMLLAETVLHGWDIASATGQDYRCAAELAEALRTPSRPMARCSASTRASPRSSRYRTTRAPSTARWACPAAIPPGSRWAAKGS